MESFKRGFFVRCGSGGIGRRVSLRSLWPKGCVGSSPTFRTISSLLPDRRTLISFSGPGNVDLRDIPWTEADMRKKNSFRASASLVILGLLLLSTCRLQMLERSLAPEDADFLSKVRYVITREERKIFLELPESERPAFREEFWKRRDPDPQTEDNPLKEEYFRRLDRAEELFRGEGRPGWLTDRGRIFILFGPPSERVTYPMTAGTSCREIWYYGAFPVVFIDQYCSGNYVLTAVNLEHLQQLNIAQGQFQKQFTARKSLFDFDVGVRTLRADEAGYEAAVSVEVPFAAIWFRYRDGFLEAVFDVRLELADPEGGILWTAAERFELSLTEDELKERRTERFRMEIPMILGLARDRLSGASLTVFVKLDAEGQEQKKVLLMKLKP
jgi:GWxTD domain-containing protein